VYDIIQRLIERKKNSPITEDKRGRKCERNFDRVRERALQLQAEA